MHYTYGVIILKCYFPCIIRWVVAIAVRMRIARGLLGISKLKIQAYISLVEIYYGYCWVHYEIRNYLLEKQEKETITEHWSRGNSFVSWSIYFCCVYVYGIVTFIIKKSPSFSHKNLMNYHAGEAFLSTKFTLNQNRSFILNFHFSAASWSTNERMKETICWPHLACLHEVYGLI